MTVVMITGTESSSSAKAAAALVAMSSGSATSLPEYGTLPDAAIESLNAVALFDPDEYEGEGPLRLSFNTRMQPWKEMGSKSFFIIPALSPPGEHILNMSFLDSSLDQLCQLRGKPTSKKTYAMLIGVAGNGQLPVDALLPGARISVATPSSFLSVIEELEEVTVNFASALNARSKRVYEAEVLEANDDKVHLDKRMRGGLQDGMGVQSQGEKQSSKLMLIDLEGGIHPTRVKKDMAEREKELGVVFRVCERERWPFIMGTECILQIEEYARVIGEQSISRANERDVGFECCSLLDRVWSLGFSSDMLLLRKLLTGDFGGSTVDALNLQKFAGRSIKIPVEMTPCPNQNMALVIAFRNLDLVLSVFYGAAFRGTTTAFIDQLEGLQRPMELAPSGFLLHSVEIVLSKYFRALRMATTVANAGLRDISTPAMCADRLRAVLKEFSSTIDTQEKLSEAMAWYQLRESRNRTSSMVVLKAKTDAKAKPAGFAASPPGTNSDAVCGEHFAGQLKVQNPRTNNTFACAFGDACRYRHEDVTAWTQAKKASTAATLGLRFRQPCIEALGKVKNGKTCV